MLSEKISEFSTKSEMEGFYSKLKYYFRSTLGSKTESRDIDLKIKKSPAEVLGVDPLQDSSIIEEWGCFTY